MNCHCGSHRSTAECCLALIEGRRQAPDAQALMRSRYTAYVLGRGDYLVATTVPRHRVAEDAALIAEHAATTQWLGLHILSSREHDGEATVEFKAYYRQDGVIAVHHEKSTFARLGGVWYYESGKLYEAAVGRNEPCPCGSGKKYKKCCAKRT